MITIDDSVHLDGVSHVVTGTDRLLVVCTNQRDCTVTFEGYPMKQGEKPPTRKRWDQYGAYYRRQLKKWLRNHYGYTYTLELNNVDPANPIVSIEPHTGST